jgi:peptidoglycan/LPS O-acetylase OafA/YrhL
MAHQRHINRPGTSLKNYFTWLHLGRVSGNDSSLISGLVVWERGKLGLGIASAVWANRRSWRAFAIVLGATLILSAAHGNVGKLAPPLIWTLCLAAQLLPGRFALIAGPLRWRVLQWLGAVSYPIYLANEPVQKALAYVLVCAAPGNPAVFDVVWLPAAIALPIGAAVVLHRYLETPAHQWGRALARRGTSFGIGTVGARS